MNVLNGLDGKSALIGGALALGGLAAAAGGLLPLLLVGGLAYLVGAKQGWWGRSSHPAGPDPMRHRQPGVPPFFAEWHRQAHAAETPYQPAAGQPAAYPPAAPAPTPPRDAEVPIPVTPAPAAANPQTTGEGGAPPA